MASSDPESPTSKKLCLENSIKVTNHAACSVPGCSNSGFTTPHLHFHNFPKDKERKSAWIGAIKRDEGPLFQVSIGANRMWVVKVCNSHMVIEKVF